MFGRTIRIALFWGLVILVASRFLGIGGSGGSAFAAQDAKEIEKLKAFLTEKALEAQKDWMVVPSIGPSIIRYISAQHSMLTAEEANQMREAVVNRPEHPGHMRLKLYGQEVAAKGKIEIGGFGWPEVVVALDGDRWIHSSQMTPELVLTAAMNGSDGWSHSGVFVTMLPTEANARVDSSGRPGLSINMSANNFRATLRNWLTGGLAVHPNARVDKVAVNTDKSFEIIMALGPAKSGLVRNYVLRGQLIPSVDIEKSLIQVNTMDVLEGQQPSDPNIKSTFEFKWGERHSDHRDAGPLGKFVPHLSQTLQQDRKVERTKKLLSVETISMEQAEQLLEPPVGRHAKESNGQPRLNLFGKPYVVQSVYDPQKETQAPVSSDGVVGEAVSVAIKQPNARGSSVATSGGSTWFIVLLIVPPLALVALVLWKRFKGA